MKIKIKHLTVAQAFERDIIDLRIAIIAQRHNVYSMKKLLSYDEHTFNTWRGFGNKSLVITNNLRECADNEIEL